LVYLDIMLTPPQRVSVFYAIIESLNIKWPERITRDHCAS